MVRLRFSKMRGVKLAWKVYKVLGRLVLATPIVKMRLIRGKTMGAYLSEKARSFFCSLLPNPLQAYGHIIYWDKKSLHYGPEIATGTYERETCILYESLIYPGMTVVDVGAHFGLYTLLAAKGVKEKGKVYAFEPEPSNYALLIKNIKANGYEDIVVTIKKAVSNKKGVSFLFLGAKESGEASLYKVPSVSTQNVVVEVITLDEFFEGEGWPEVHLIKMDIEGGEKEALEGARQLLERNQVKLIIEFNPKIQAAVGIAPEEFLDTLSKFGFRKIWAIYNGLRPVNPELLRMAGGSYINLLCEK